MKLVLGQCWNLAFNAVYLYPSYFVFINTKVSKNHQRWKVENEVGLFLQQCFFTHFDCYILFIYQKTWSPLTLYSFIYFISFSALGSERTWFPFWSMRGFTASRNQDFGEFFFLPREGQASGPGGWIIAITL